MIELNQFKEGFRKVDHSLINTWDWEKISLRVTQNIATEPRYYRDLGNGGFTLGGMDLDPYCKIVLQYLHLNKPGYHPRAGLYVSTKPDSKSFPKHNDPGQYLWIWQILGNTRWIVEGQEMTLRCGEVLYISPGLYHHAIPFEPRASITFSLEQYE